MHRFSPRPNRAGEIAWRAFEAAAFDEARRLGRPVLLSISAVWCHWCHVMDETSYSDAAVLDLIRDRYVPVRVDRDQRPDIDRRYNQGGWPTTCVLNAQGAILWGGTYVPPDLFRRALASLADQYAARPDLAEALPEAPHEHPEAEPGTEADAFDRDGAIDALLLSIGAQEDRAHGGFGSEGPKFPQVEALGFLDALAEAPGERGRAARDILQRALDGMLDGDLEDRVEGGFYRYATRPDWREPHYEKMLGDNAVLSALYLRAAARTGDARMRQAGEAALGFLDRVLWQDGAGAYGGSQDADEAYVKLHADERSLHGAPYVDPVVYTTPNCEMVETLVAAWAVLGRPDLRARAVSLWDGLVVRMWRAGSGMAHYDNGQGPMLWHEAADAAQALSAVATLLPFGRVQDRETARALADHLLDRFIDASGSLVERAAEVEVDAPAAFLRGGRMPLSAESGRCALALVRVGRFLGEDRYIEAARRMVSAWAAQMASLGTFGGELGRAAVELGPELEVRVAAGPEGPEPDTFLAAAVRSGVHPLTIRVVAADERTAEGLSDAPRTAAYPCRQGACLAPVMQSALLPETLRELQGGAHGV